MRIILAVLLVLFLVTPSHAVSLNLKWTDTSDNEDGFIIERNANDGKGFVELARTGTNIATFSDLNAPLNTTNCYRVKAYNRFGISAPTNELCVKVYVPSQPTSLVEG